MAALQRDNLEIIIPGMTHLIERNGREAYVYFGEDGVAHMLLDDGETRSGRWEILEDGYVAEWDTGATGRWTIEHAPGSVSYVNRDSDARLRMIGVMFGNPMALPRQRD